MTPDLARQQQIYLLLRLLASSSQPEGSELNFEPSVLSVANGGKGVPFGKNVFCLWACIENIFQIFTPMKVTSESSSRGQGQLARWLAYHTKPVILLCE